LFFYITLHTNLCLTIIIGIYFILYFSLYSTQRGCLTEKYESLLLARPYHILFLILTTFYLLIVGVEGYCCVRPHTTTHTNYGRTSLDEETARHRHLYLTTHNVQNIQTSMRPAGFETVIPASEWPQTHVLGGAFNVIGNTIFNFSLLSKDEACDAYGAGEMGVQGSGGET